MLTRVSLNHILEDISDLLDQGCTNGRWEMECLKLRRYGYDDPKVLVVKWRETRGKGDAPVVGD